jgi:hypothetical protein
MYVWSKVDHQNGGVFGAGCVTVDHWSISSGGAGTPVPCLACLSFCQLSQCDL